MKIKSILLGLSFIIASTPALVASKPSNLPGFERDDTPNSTVKSSGFTHRTMEELIALVNERDTLMKELETQPDPAKEERLEKVKLLLKTTAVG